jgi:hypothetical protein
MPEEKIAFILRMLSHQSHLTHFSDHIAADPYCPEFLDNLALIPSLTSLHLQSTSSYRNIDPGVLEDLKNILINHGSWMSTRLTNLSLRNLLRYGEIRGTKLLGSLTGK